MRASIAFLAVSLAAFATRGAPDAAGLKVGGSCLGDVEIKCENPGGWKFSARLFRNEGLGDRVSVTLSSETEAQPPKFEVSFSVPQRDIHFVWHSGAENPVLPPAWNRGFVSSLAKNMPLVALLDAADRATAVFAASEAVLPVRCRAGLKEADCTVPCSLAFFEYPSAPCRKYTVHVLLARPDGYWGDAVRKAVGWIEMHGGYAPMAAPESAFDPLYSTWYAFAQDVTAAKIEAEAERAAAIGMKTLILDDGWQTDEKGRAYERCGDLTVSKAKFPDGMAEHVRRVKGFGIRYVVWFTASMIGHKNAQYERFKGKYLRKLDGVHCDVLDPRFPEVREYLVEMFERALKEWGIDGFKLDYVGQFALEPGEKDPAEAENFAGRDTKSVPEGVDRLMSTLMARLRAVRPDVLVEYRQPYLGPAIRQYGNMIRAIDCPGEMQKNIIRTADLRLTSGKTAVHSDMLEWNVEDDAEKAAKPVLAALFSTIQYSMVLSRLPERHLEMLSHWIAFTQRHRRTLLKSGFSPHHPEANFPLVEAESKEERIAAVYMEGAVAKLPAGKRGIIVNATDTESVVVESPAPVLLSIYDTFGTKASEAKLPAGISRVSIPLSGYAEAE